MRTDDQELSKIYSCISLNENAQDLTRQERIDILKNNNPLKNNIKIKQFIDEMYEKYNEKEPGYAYARITGVLESIIGMYLRRHPESELQDTINKYWANLHKE